MESNKIFGQNLKRLRISRDLTQEAAAELFGMPQPRYYRHESGTTEANLSFILKACEIFQASPNELLGTGSAPASTVEGALTLLADLGYRVTLEKREH